jgi:hypothetical protein
MTAHDAAGLPRQGPTAAMTSHVTATTRGDRPSRIHITGGPGSGKTTLAMRLAAATDLPVHHLDDIARVGGGEGALRSTAERVQSMAAILASDGWITEGVHLDWTAPLMERAEVIVWLDHVSSPRAAWRMLRRFVSGAVSELRTRPGRQKVTRIGDYARNLGALVAAIGQSRRYYGAPGTPAQADIPAGEDVRMPISATLDSRAATLATLQPYRARLAHCRTSADVEAFVRDIECAAAPAPP